MRPLDRFVYFAGETEIVRRNDQRFANVVNGLRELVKILGFGRLFGSG